MDVLQSSGKDPVVHDMLTICVMVLSTSGSMSLIRFLGIASSSQVLFFMLSISLSISSLVSIDFWDVLISVLELKSDFFDFIKKEWSKLFC